MGSAFPYEADRLPFRDPALPLGKRVERLGAEAGEARLELPRPTASTTSR
ncbi:hypothetical protein AB0I00_24015 [Streptomyces sp. NPDC050803]